MLAAAHMQPSEQPWKRLVLCARHRRSRSDQDEHEGPAPARASSITTWLCVAVPTLIVVCGWLVALSSAYVIPLRLLLRGDLPRSGRAVPLLVGCELVNFLLVLPIWPLQVCYGNLFGVVRGSLVAIAAYTVACFPPYILAPIVLRIVQSCHVSAVTVAKHEGEVTEPGAWLPWLWAKARGWVARYNVAAGVQSALQQQPLTTTMALRLNLLPPAGLTSYALGACRVPLGRYVLGSAVGNIPNAVAYVYVGTLISSLSDILTGRIPFSPVSSALLTSGLLLSFGLLYLLSRAAAARLAAAAQEGRAELLDDEDGRPTHRADSRSGGPAMV